MSIYFHIIYWCIFFGTLEVSGNCFKLIFSWHLQNLWENITAKKIFLLNISIINILKTCLIRQDICLMTPSPLGIMFSCRLLFPDNLIIGTFLHKFVSYWREAQSEVFDVGSADDDTERSDVNNVITWRAWCGVEGVIEVIETTKHEAEHTESQTSCFIYDILVILSATHTSKIMTLVQISRR